MQQPMINADECPVASSTSRDQSSLTQHQQEINANVYPSQQQSSNSQQTQNQKRNVGRRKSRKPYRPRYWRKYIKEDERSEEYLFQHYEPPTLRDKGPLKKLRTEYPYKQPQRRFRWAHNYRTERESFRKHRRDRPEGENYRILLERGRMNLYYQCLNDGKRINIVPYLIPSEVSRMIDPVQRNAAKLVIAQKNHHFLKSLEEWKPVEEDSDDEESVDTIRDLADDNEVNIINVDHLSASDEDRSDSDDNSEVEDTSDDSGIIEPFNDYEFLVSEYCYLSDEEEDDENITLAG